MLGLFGTLNLGQRSLQAHRQGVEVAGHNLANVNQPGYTRQRLALQSTASLHPDLGSQGTGVEGVAIRQIRDNLLDRQIQGELSVRGSLDAQQSILQQAQAALGQTINRQAESASSSSAVAAPTALAGGLADLFASFQALAAAPASMEARQNVIAKAQNLAAQFNQADQRLQVLADSLNQSIVGDVTSANQLLGQIADLNAKIAGAEIGRPGSANDLRDVRRLKIEELSSLIRADFAEDDQGMVHVSVGGVLLVEGHQLADTLEARDTGAGHREIFAPLAGAALTPVGGKLHGLIEVRNQGLTDLRRNLDTLAEQLAAEVNALHSPGYSLDGAGGADFFTGTSAATLQVNSPLVSDPALIQASAVSTDRGNNQVALALAQLDGRSWPALQQQSFTQFLGQTVAALGYSLDSVKDQITSQKSLQEMLARQRDSISAVSLDEEMTDLMKYQKAFEASARLITTIDEMLNTVVNMAQ